MGIILDTSVIIAAERSGAGLIGSSVLGGGEPAVISAVTASELLFGLEQAKHAHIKERRQRFVEAILAHLSVAKFGLPEARHHARIHAILTARGQRIGSHDLLIAATALALDLSLITLNEREFIRIPGLRLLPAMF